MTEKERGDMCEMAFAILRLVGFAFARVCAKLAFVMVVWCWALLFCRLRFWAEPGGCAEIGRVLPEYKKLKASGKCFPEAFLEGRLNRWA